jgi:hypothetical protein
MVATTRMLALSTLLAMFVGLVLAHRADAAPFRPRPYSESSRLEAKVDCQLGGGTSFETVYHYDFGSSVPTSATTTCHGGKNDGQTCEISGSSKSCSKALLPASESLGALPSETVIEPLAASSAPSTTRPTIGTVDGTIQTAPIDAEDEDRNG